jgi:polygalacturonase
MYNVRDYGAVANGEQLDSHAIQKAIDACCQAGGGTVQVVPGRYKCGTIILKDNVTLYLEAGATIIGSGDLADYRDDIEMFVDAVGHKRGRCLIYANQVKNIGIAGFGTIDGNGASFVPGTPRHKERPFLVRIVNCTDVRVQDVTLMNSAAWVSHYLGSKDITIRGVKIHSRINENNDGIDIDSCQNVCVSDCNISTGDDSICLKATTTTPCRNIAVTNCVLSSGCGAIKMGTESIGDMKNVAISNCTIYDTGLCGIKILSMDGSCMENIVISNITMDQTTGPIFLRLGNRGNVYFSCQKPRPAGAIRNVTISNIQALVHADVKEKSGILITGIPGHAIENLSLRDISMSLPGGGTKEDASRMVPERIADYPEHHYFGVLPSYGIFLRHAKEVQLDNIQIKLRARDEREAVYCENVANLNFSNMMIGEHKDLLRNIVLKESSHVIVENREITRES